MGLTEEYRIDTVPADAGRNGYDPDAPPTDPGERLEAWLAEHQESYPAGIDHVWEEGDGLTLTEPVGEERFRRVMEDAGYRVTDGIAPGDSLEVHIPTSMDAVWEPYGFIIHPGRDIDLGRGGRGAALDPGGEPVDAVVEETLDVITVYLDAVCTDGPLRHLNGARTDCRGR